MTHSRRDALRLLGAGAAVACGPVAQSFAATPGDTSRGDLAPGRAQFFGLGAVRLGAGPFLDAQRLDANYLLSLDCDRMLANFRSNAGLAPKAPVYGGWESVEPWVDIRCHGHTLGHYLGAAACMYRATGDERFAQRVDYLVAELAECQRHTGGWLTAFPDGVAPLVDSFAGGKFAGVPWYTTHKVLAGLRDAHLQRGSHAAFDVWLKFSDWVVDAAKDVPDDRFQKMLDREHGGMAEVLADLFAITGEQRHLEIAQRFVHRAFYEPLARREDKLDGLHANTQIPKVIGLQRIHDLKGPAEYGTAARFFWETVVETRSFATGGHGDGEHFFPPNDFAAHLGSAKTMETCCTHNMMRLTRALYEREASPAYLDNFERSLFNGILASQDPSSGMMTYFQAMRPGYVKLFHTPIDSFWCCTGSGMENHARYGESIYSREDDTLFVNLFIASTLDWQERGVRVEQATRFPDADTTKLTIASNEANAFTLAIRQPAWCPVMTVTVNGREQKRSRRPGSYFKLARSFRAGDVIEVRVPMSLRLEPLPHAPQYVALAYGPIVLAGIFYDNPVKPAEQLIVNERESGKMLNELAAIPRWTRPLGELLANTKRTNSGQLVFLARGFEGGKSVKLIPWHRVSNQRYNLYWQGPAAS
jgi:uncharacterized protein